MLARIMAAAAFAAVLSPAAAPADPVGGSCSPRTVKFVASEPLHFRTSSQTYIDLPQARVGFRQGGRMASCVLVRFSAMPQANRNMGFRALLDDTEAALPYEGQISDGADVAPAARRFIFIFPSVTPGAHTVQVQYQSTSQGGTDDMNAHNTIVWHAP